MKNDHKVIIYLSLSVIIKLYNDILQTATEASQNGIPESSKGARLKEKKGTLAL